MNIGYEEDGKNELYQRPVLVIRKFNKHIFLGIPLTTQIKDNPYYFKISFRNKIQCALLSQIRVFDSKRLTDLMGTLGDEEFAKVKKAIKDII